MMLSFLQEKVTIAIERKRNTIKKTLQFYERERKKWYEIMYTWSDKKEENFFFICSTTWKFITYLYLSPHQTKDHTFCQYLLWNIAIHNLYYRLVCARDNGRKRERTRTFARALDFIFIFQSFTYLMGIIRNHLLYHIERWCQVYARAHVKFYRNIRQ